MNKTYTVTVKRHCPDCGKDHKVLYSSLTYKAPTPVDAARSAHEYLAFGGPYQDLCWLAKEKSVFFAVKERGTPRGTGITLVEQTTFIGKKKNKKQK